MSKLKSVNNYEKNMGNKVKEPKEPRVVEDLLVKQPIPKEDWTEMKKLAAEINSMENWLWVCRQPDFLKAVELNNVSGCREIAKRMLVIK